MGEPVGKRPWFCLLRRAEGRQGRHLGLEDDGRLAASPKKFAPGTKMTFAGLVQPAGPRQCHGLPQRKGSNLPAAAAAGGAAPQRRAADAAAADAAPKPGTGPGNGPQKGRGRAADQPGPRRRRGRPLGPAMARSEAPTPDAYIAELPADRAAEIARSATL